MLDVFLWLVAIFWLLGTCVRIYRQIRFYQIEEYMSLRYLRWVVAKRERWLPIRPLIAFAAGGLVTLVLTESSDGIFPFVVNAVSAIIAAIPPRDREIKKVFRPTTRARRLLGASIFSGIIVMLVSLWLPLDLRTLGIVEFSFILTATVGLIIYLLAPIFLVTGNLIMAPVEAVLRQRFINNARRVLAQVDPIVIGITGSYGKTSTKHYLAHILSGRYKTYPTPKSYNTMMGVCIAINNDLARDYSVEYFIAEMGAYIPGEIARLCDLTHPRIGIEIEVGPQHLERFGSLDNIANAKYELIKALPVDGIGVFNWDNPYVRAMYERGYPATRIAVSRELDPANVPAGGPRFIASQVQEALDGLRFVITDAQTGHSETVYTPLLGIHNVTNILLAAAVAIHEGMTLPDVARRVRTLQPAESRLVRQTTPQGITVLNDAYSANPIGIVSALRALSLHASDRRVLITPGMVELGPLMERENRLLGEIAAKHATDVILIGSRQTTPIKEGLLSAGFPADHVLVMETLAEAQDWYQRQLKPGDSVLFLNDLPDTYST